MLCQSLCRAYCKKWKEPLWSKVLHLFRSVQLSKLYSHATQHCFYALQYVTKEGRQLTSAVQRQWSYLACQWGGGQ